MRRDTSLLAWQMTATLMCMQFSKCCISPSTSTRGSFQTFTLRNLFYCSVFGNHKSCKHQNTTKVLHEALSYKWGLRQTCTLYSWALPELPFITSSVHKFNVITRCSQVAEGVQFNSAFLRRR